MANKTTTDEDAAGSLDGTELVRVVKSGGNKRTTTGAIAELAGSAAEDLTGTTIAINVVASSLTSVAAGTIGTGVTLAKDTDTSLAANSDTRVATQKAVKAYIDGIVTGLLDFKGSIDASGNPNHQAASKGDAYYISVAGKVGGASGKSVEVGDVVVASADNAGGTEASVGTSWFVLEHNLVGAIVSGGALGTPSSGTLTNCSGLPIAGIASLGTGVGTALANPVNATGGVLTYGNAAVLGANTFTAGQTFSPGNNEAAFTFNRATSGVGTIATNGTTTVTGTGTKFLTQVAPGDTITPSGQSVRTVSYVVSDTSLVLTATASGTGSGLSYTLSGGSYTQAPNGSFSMSLSTGPGCGQQSERFGAGATCAGTTSVTVGQGASCAGTTSVTVGQGATCAGTGSISIGQGAAAATNGVAVGKGASASAGVAIGYGTTTSDGGNATAVAIGFQTTCSYQSIVIGRGATASADGQLVIGSNATVGAHITDVWIGGSRLSATPVGVTYHGTGGAGSNIVGSNVAIAGGISTGTGAGGNVGFQTAPTLQSSGGTANALIDRSICVAAGKALTSGVAASLVDIALPTLKMAGGTLRYNIICSDGTDMQSLAGEIVWSAVNKGGSYTVAVKTPGGATADDTTAAKSVSAGTLTLSWALTSGSNKVTLQPTATTSLTATTFRMYYQIENHSDQAITPL